MRVHGMRIVFLLGIFLSFSTACFSGNQGHYYPGVMSLRDFVQPPKGVYFAMYNPYYHADAIKNASGDEIGNLSRTGTLSQTLTIGGPFGGGVDIPVTLNGTLNVDIDAQVDTVIQQPTLVWNTGLNVWGLNHTMLLSVPMGYMRVDVEAEARGAGTLRIGNIVNRPITISEKVEIEDEKYGLGDIFFSPVWMAKSGKRYDIGSGYGFYAPTGAYDEGDIANIGFGFWTHQWQANGAYYLNDIKATALVFNTTYELHSYKYDKDVRPGQNVTLEYGISQYLHERFEIGVASSHQWQISRDHGEQAVNNDVKDRINAIGGQMTFWPMKGKMMITAKCNWEYGGVDRPEGLMSSLNLTWVFGDPINEKIEKQNKIA